MRRSLGPPPGRSVNGVARVAGSAAAGRVGVRRVLSQNLDELHATGAGVKHGLSSHRVVRRGARGGLASVALPARAATRLGAGAAAGGVTDVDDRFSLFSYGSSDDDDIPPPPPRLGPAAAAVPPPPPGPPPRRSRDSSGLAALQAPVKQPHARSVRFSSDTMVRDAASAPALSIAPTSGGAVAVEGGAEAAGRGSGSSTGGVAVTGADPVASSSVHAHDGMSVVPDVSFRRRDVPRGERNRWYVFGDGPAAASSGDGGDSVGAAARFMTPAEVSYYEDVINAQERALVEPAATAAPAAVLVDTGDPSASVEPSADAASGCAPAAPLVVDAAAPRAGSPLRRNVSPHPPGAEASAAGGGPEAHAGPAAAVGAAAALAEPSNDAIDFSAAVQAASDLNAPLFQHWRGSESSGEGTSDAGTRTLRLPDATDPYGFTAFLLPMADLEAASRGGGRGDDGRHDDSERAWGAADEASDFVASLRPRIGVAGVLRVRSTKWRAEVLAPDANEAPRPMSRFVSVPIPEVLGSGVPEA